MWTCRQVMSRTSVPTPRHAVEDPGSWRPGCEAARLRGCGFRLPLWSIIAILENPDQNHDGDDDSHVGQDNSGDDTFGYAECGWAMIPVMMTDGSDCGKVIMAVVMATRMVSAGNDGGSDAVSSMIVVTIALMNGQCFPHSLEVIQRTHPERLSLLDGYAPTEEDKEGLGLRMATISILIPTDIFIITVIAASQFLSSVCSVNPCYSASSRLSNLRPLPTQYHRTHAHTHTHIYIYIYQPSCLPWLLRTGCCRSEKMNLRRATSSSMAA